MGIQPKLKLLTFAVDGALGGGRGGLALSLSLSLSLSYTHTLFSALSHTLSFSFALSLSHTHTLALSLSAVDGALGGGRGGLPWREAGPSNHHDDKVDSDQ